MTHAKMTPGRDDTTPRRDEDAPRSDDERPSESGQGPALAELERAADEGMIRRTDEQPPAERDADEDGDVGSER